MERLICIIPVNYDLSIRFSCAVNEIVETYDDHFSEALNKAKKHAGQQKVAAKMRKYLSDSSLIKKREEHLYNPNKNQDTILREKVQEYYSLRCVPQIIGPILDTLEYAENILENEINSANDNPMTIAEDGQVYHGEGGGGLPRRLYRSGNG